MKYIKLRMKRQPNQMKYTNISLSNFVNNQVWLVRKAGKLEAGNKCSGTL